MKSRKLSPKGPTCTCHGVYLDECPVVIAALRADDEFTAPPHNDGTNQLNNPKAEN